MKPKLFVAADYDPALCGGSYGVAGKVIELARELEGLPVTLKLNSALRANGLDLASRLFVFSQNIFADYKLVDIPETLTLDGRFINDCAIIDYVTVMCNANVKAMEALLGELQPLACEVIGVTVPTSWSETDCFNVYGCSMAEAVKRMALLGAKAGVDGFVASGYELEMLRGMLELKGKEFYIPGIRPEWALVPGDDQQRIVTPTQAVRMGADGIIIGRPVTGAKPNDKGRPQSPREAVEWVLKEMEQASASAGKGE